RWFVDLPGGRFPDSTENSTPTSADVGVTPTDFDFTRMFSAACSDADRKMRAFMHPALSIPEVRWFVRGPKVAIFEMPQNDAAFEAAARSRLKADQTEEIAPEDILAEIPAEFAPARPDSVLARAETLEREETRTVIRAYKTPRAGWLVA